MFFCFDILVVSLCLNVIIFMVLIYFCNVNVCIFDLGFLLFFLEEDILYWFEKFLIIKIFKIKIKIR